MLTGETGRAGQRLRAEANTEGHTLPASLQWHTPQHTLHQYSLASVAILLYPLCNKDAFLFFKINNLFLEHIIQSTVTIIQDLTLHSEKIFTSMCNILYENIRYMNNVPVKHNIYTYKHDSNISNLISNR